MSRWVSDNSSSRSPSVLARVGDAIIGNLGVFCTASRLESDWPEAFTGLVAPLRIGMAALLHFDLGYPHRHAKSAALRKQCSQGFVTAAASDKPLVQ
jgi:hypothetical protein